MAEVQIAINEVRDPALSRMVEDEIYDAAAAVPAAGEGTVGVRVLDEGLHVDVEMELDGWVERYPLTGEAQPGEVRRAVEKFLRDVGLIA